MNQFRNGNIKESIVTFNQAEEIDNTITPFLWQRGISYYYANMFQEGSNQFRNDVKVNPLDVEEIVWDIACQLRLDQQQSSFPPKNMLSLPKGRQDRRKIMSTVYKLFRDECKEVDLAKAGLALNTNNQSNNKSAISDEFYALLYLGLFSEARGYDSKAEYYMKSACDTNYAKGFGSYDYMVAVANIHCNIRGWA